ncbi:MAG: hypothetical protein LC687_05595 [Actinobacteria bacterium]|nr:hypothetical protein [Actinomycetota bacterium]
MQSRIEELERALDKAQRLIQEYKQEPRWSKKTLIGDDISDLLNSISEVGCELLREMGAGEVNVIEREDGSVENAGAVVMKLQNDAAAVRRTLIEYVNKREKPTDYDYTKAERQKRFRKKQQQKKQRSVYAAQRASRACDRVIVSTDPVVKDQAAKWARAWSQVSYYRG